MQADWLDLTPWDKGKRMTHEIEFKPRAVKDLRHLERETARRIIERIEGMRENLAGDVKHLTSATPEYRLRVGDYRVLFEVDNKRIVIYRILHRRDAYR